MPSCGESVYWHNRTRNLCLAVAFAFLVSMSLGYAQVTIKERMEIGGARLPNATVYSVLSTGEAIWVAPAPGFWKLRVTTAWQALSPISSAYFQVITPEATFTGNVAEWASRQDNQWFTFFDYCTGRDTLGWYYAISGVTPYDRTLAIHVASAGDTLRFRYHSDFGTSDFAEIYQDPFPEWVIKLGLDHPCIRREAFTPPHDLCQLHLSYFYDTTFTRFAVEIPKDTLTHGDTLEFHVVAMSELNQETPLAGDTPLTLRISPSEYGRFITQTGGSVSSPLDSIRYQDAREGRIRFVADGTTPDSLQSVALEAVQMSDTAKRGNNTIWVKSKVIKILLGESKYFRARNHPTQTDKLIIEETTTPLIGAAIPDSVWRGTPVTEISGGKVGVYWDLKTATIRTDTLDPVMIDLPLGLIRIIGWYWDRDSTYKVKLTARHEGRTGEVTIEVKRPDYLGTTNSTVTGPTVLNGVDSTWNVDSLIIEFAGKEGILPQVVKGMITHESVGFHPSYRYEPIQDLTLIQRQGGVFDSTHRYWIRSETNLGNPAIPQHNNVHIATNRPQVIQYPGYRTVWSIYTDTVYKSLFARRVYKNLQRQWRMYFEFHRDSLRAGGMDSASAALQATTLSETSYVLWLRNSIGGLGMINTIAQTRISASYGLMQLTYYAGVAPHASFVRWGYKYPDRDASFLPEYINIPRVGLKYGVLHFKGWLRFALGSTHFTENNWPQGLEYLYWWGLYMYNGSQRKTYPNPVFGYANDYPPRRND